MEGEVRTESKGTQRPEPKRCGGNRSYGDEKREREYALRRLIHVIDLAPAKKACPEKVGPSFGFKHLSEGAALQSVDQP
jgi:hypothetical protein